MPDTTVGGDRDTAVNATVRQPCFQGAYVLVGVGEGGK